MTAYLCTVKFPCAQNFHCAKEPDPLEREWQTETRQLLREALPGARLRRAEPAGDPHPDLEADWKGFRLWIDVKVVHAPRIDQVEGLLARFALQSRSSGPRDPDVPVLIVAFDRYGPRLEHAVRDFMASYASETAWGLIDRRGQATLVVPRLAVDWRRAPSSDPAEPQRLERRDRSLFTDLNRWMLKVLILRSAPPALWGGPREPARHPTDLARIAGVSTSKAHHFSATFERAGYLQKSMAGLRLVRLAELLPAWLQDEKNRPPRRLPVRSLLPARAPVTAESAEQQAPDLPPEAWAHTAVGGSLAAMQGGLLRVGGRQPPLVHVEGSLSRAMKAWQLEACDPRDARMILVKSSYPESVFRGTVRREAGPPAVDLWQIALDAVACEARGEEQAEFLMDRVLALQERP